MNSTIRECSNVNAVLHDSSYSLCSFIQRILYSHKKWQIYKMKNNRLILPLCSEQIYTSSDLIYKKKLGQQQLIYLVWTKDINFCWSNFLLYIRSISVRMGLTSYMLHRTGPQRRYLNTSSKNTTWVWPYMGHILKWKCY